MTAPALVDTIGEITRTRPDGVTEDELDGGPVAGGPASSRWTCRRPGSIAGALATLVVHGLPDDYYATLRQQLLDADRGARSPRRPPRTCTRRA